MLLGITSNILNIYLEQIQGNDMDILLHKFVEVKHFNNDSSRTIGLLKYNNISDNIAFQFKFDELKILHFHTVGMKFNINLEFFDEEGDLVKMYSNLKPGIKDISSVKPAMYAVEYKATREI